MDHITELALLLDTYGILLTSRQREILHLKTDEDFSLAEIAETCGISRQGAHDALHRAEQQLKAFESQLGLVRRGQTLQKALHCLYASRGEAGTPSGVTDEEWRNL